MQKSMRKHSLRIFKYCPRQQAVLEHVRQSYRKKKTINIVEPLIKKNNSYTFNDKEISDILKETHFDKKAGSFDNIMVH